MNYSVCLAALVVSSFHVGDAEYKCKHHAESPHRNITNRQEIIFATKRIGGADDEALLALEGFHLIIVNNFEIILPWSKGLVDSAPQLPKIRQPSSSHPHDEMFCKNIISK